MIKPTELAICDVLKHSEHGLVCFQPTCSDRSDEIIVTVRNLDFRLLIVSLNDCGWPTRKEYDEYWKIVNEKYENYEN
jgi:hypothetical protein